MLPSKEQLIALYKKFDNAIHVVHSIKPKLTQKKIHNALPLITNLNADTNVKGAIPQVKAQIFYIAGSIEIAVNLTGIKPLEEARLFHFKDYVVEGSAEALNNNDNGIIIGIGIAKKMALQVGHRIQISTIKDDIFPLRIVEIYQSGISDVDAIQSFANLKTVQKILGEAENYITEINVKLSNIDLALPMSKKIKKQFELKAIDINTANAKFETETSVRNLIK